MSGGSGSGGHGKCTTLIRVVRVSVFLFDLRLNSIRIKPKLTSFYVLWGIRTLTRSTLSMTLIPLLDS
jgi:hypothetical protein